MNFEIITSQLILPEMIEKTCKEAGWMDDWSVAQIFDTEQPLASGREKSSTKNLQNNPWRSNIKIWNLSQQPDLPKFQGIYYVVKLQRTRKWITTQMIFKKSVYYSFAIIFRRQWRMLVKTRDGVKMCGV